MPDTPSGDSHAAGVILALPQLAWFTNAWRASSYASKAPDLAEERRFPPHVTVLTPFAGPGDAGLLEQAIERLRAVAATHPALDLVFARAEQFGPGGAVWLVPEPSAAVSALVRDVYSAFPEYPAYDGKHPEPVPHLTVTVVGDDATLEQVRAALAAQGPLAARVGELGVWQRSADDVWQLIAEVPLAG